MRILLWAFCLTMVTPLLPARLHALDLTGSDNGRKVTLPPKETLTITLAGNPTTGFTWELTHVDSEILAAGNRPEYVPDFDRIGAGGKFTFHFTPRRPGTTFMKLVYHRPWEKDVPPLQTFELTVLVSAAGKRVNTATYRSIYMKKLTAAFDLDLKRVTVKLPDGRSMTLPLAISGSGARYSNGTFTFWEHQGIGRFYKGKKLMFEGKLLGPRQEKPQPGKDGVKPGSGPAQ